MLADIPDAPYFTVVKVDRKMDVKRAAELAELPLEDFLALNPQHNRPVIAGADEYTILLPIDKAEIFAAKLELTDQPLVSWQAYRLKADETLPQVAAKFGMSVETLRAVNGIGARARVPVGHMLLVPAQRPTLRGGGRRCRRRCSRRCRRAARSTTPCVAATRCIDRGALRGVARRAARSGTGCRRTSVAAGQRLRVTSDVVRARRLRAARSRSRDGATTKRRESAAAASAEAGARHARGSRRSAGRTPAVAKPRRSLALIAARREVGGAAS